MRVKEALFFWGIFKDCPPPPGYVKIPKIPGPPSLGPISFGRTTEIVPIEKLPERLNHQRRVLGAPPVEFYP